MPSKKNIKILSYQDHCNTITLAMFKSLIIRDDIDDKIVCVDTDKELNR